MESATGATTAGATAAGAPVAATTGAGEAAASLALAASSPHAHMVAGQLVAMAHVVWHQKSFAPGAMLTQLASTGVAAAAAP